MLIEPDLLTTGTRLVTFGLSSLVLAIATIRAPWRTWLDDRERQWVWLASLALLVAVWSMKAGITPGLSVSWPLPASPHGAASVRTCCAWRSCPRW